jgi:hypothetical protein
VFSRIKNLFQNLAVYGLGDAATSIASLLLLPIYTRYLTPEDYGVITMLLMVEAVAKVTFRWGVDTAFMRLYYDCKDQLSRQQLASTVFFFLLVVNGALLCVVVAGAGRLSTLLFGTDTRAWLIRMVLANTFVTGFYFMPFHVLRISERTGKFVALGFGRSAGTLVMRLVFVIAGHLGVFGVVLADLVVTAIFTPILSLWVWPLIRPAFSRDVLREALGFGLPRIPHSIANQVIALADRTFLNAYARLADVGVYSVGASFGMAPKLFLSAFESAWTPFFLSVMHEKDARRTYSTVSTYVMLVLVLLVAGLAGRGAGSAAPHDHEAVSSRVRRDAVDRARRDVPGRVPRRIDRHHHHEADGDLPGRHGNRRGGQPRRQRLSDSAVRNPRRGLGERDGVRHARARDRRLLAAVLPDLVRVGPAAPDRGRGPGGRAVRHVVRAGERAGPRGPDRARRVDDGDVRAGPVCHRVLPSG